MPSKIAAPARQGMDRLGLSLATAGAVLAVAAALLLWKSEGAAIFMSATVGALMTCF